eukprot:6330719-Lingulodinium_polyedra.AAC.1
MSASGSPGPVPRRPAAASAGSRVPNQVPRIDSLSSAARCASATSWSMEPGRCRRSWMGSQ